MSSSMALMQKLLTRRQCKTTLDNLSTVGSLFSHSHRSLHVSCKDGLRSSWCENDPYVDPSTELQKLLLKPLYAPSDVTFSPSVDEMKRADVLFRQHRKIETTLRVVDNLPPASGSEVCFLGRSNVGKSSLIKALFFDPSKLKIVVSKTPGRTRTLNFYSIDKVLSLVDMPGYGYNMPEHYNNSVENYIRNRSSLVRTFLLLDSKLDLSPTDKIGIEMLQEFGKPYVIIMTKIDKSSHHRVLRSVLDISKYREQHMSAALPQIFLVSSHQNIGLSMLRAFIINVTGLNQVDDTKQCTSISTLPRRFAA